MRASETLKSVSISSAHGAIYGLLGLFFCLILALAPDVLPAIFGRDGYIWTPINSPQYRFGDNYYYAAWVAEGIQNGFPPHSPSASEYSDKKLLETIRWFPLAVAALPSLLTSDFRLVYVLDYAFTVCFLFGIPFYLSYRLTKNPLGSLVIGALVLFQIEFWSNIPVAPGFPGSPYPSAWLVEIWRNFFSRVKAVSTIFEYEFLASFRYINLSISGPILMGYAALCHLIYAKNQPSYLTVTGLLLLSPCMAFSYPSHTLVAYAALGAYALLAYLQGHIQSAKTLLLIGVGTALLLLLGGYIEFVRTTMAENELWNNIFNRDTMTLIDRPLWSMALIVFLNKYTITGLAALWLTWNHRELRDLVIVFGSIGCILGLTGLFDMPQLWGRFLVRGIDHLWLTTFAISALWGWTDRFKPWILSKNLPGVLKIAKATIVGFVLVVPALGFGTYAFASAQNLTRFMPQGRWEALQWINNNVRHGDIIAALDWDDITFIPIYTPANLFVDNMIVGGRSPHDELKRYIVLWKLLGFPRDLLESRLSRMVGAANKRLSSNRDALLNPPLVDGEVYASGQIAEAVLYWPYVKTVGGNEIAFEGRTTGAFLKSAMEMYDSIDPNQAATNFPFSTLVLSGVELKLPMNPTIPLIPVFRNSTHIFYKRLH